MEVQDIGTTSYLSVSSSYYSCNILLFNFYMNSEIFCPGCDTSLLTQTEAKDSFWIHYEFICRLSADLKWGNWQSIYNYSPFYLQGLWINKETSITSPTWIIQFTGAVSDNIQTRTSLSALTPNREKSHQMLPWAAWDVSEDVLRLTDLMAARPFAMLSAWPQFGSIQGY